MRVRLLIALALVGVLAGCQESGFDESRETQRPLKVQHALDPLTGTKVPGQAERPLTLTADALGDALALGVTPVGAAYVPPFMKEQARGIEVVPPDDPVVFEATDPDVILGSKDLQGDDYDVLRQIAPTVLSDGEDWKLNLRLHGEALGRTNDAEELLIDWDNRVAKVRKAFRGRRVTAVVSQGRSTGEFSLEPGSIGGSILDDLGIRKRRGADLALHVTGGAAWTGGGVLAARAALADVARAAAAAGL
ncbi:MAG: iron-siderophore transport system substrate-binding protein [Thermoleophilaceae bacterium]|jgi:iron complex transport system substrate-binding protein|nr:iron-siderophore transport system substrate-binding protein [Thermoleophilaceae bacterium]